jgi:hypothetical protein
MDLGSGIRDLFRIPPGSRGQKGTGSRIRNRNIEQRYLGAGCGNDQVELLEEVRSLLAALLLVSNHLHLVSSNY